MNEIKYQITQLIFLVLLGLGAYWALTHLDNGVSYTREKVVQEDQADIQDLEQNTGGQNDIMNDEPIVTPSEPEQDESTNTTDDPSGGTTALSSEDQELVNALERLISDNIYMKVGSRGTRVGTVQKFLVKYFPDKNISTDNDYGNGTRDLVREFQSAEGLTADGQAGPTTYQKMIEILKKA